MGPTRTYQLLGTTMAPSMMSCGTVSSFAGSLLPHAEDPAACAFWFALDSSIYNSLLMMNSILIGPRQLGHRFFSFEAGNQLLQFGHQWKSRPHQGSLPIQTCRHASLGVPSLGVPVASSPFDDIRHKGPVDVSFRFCPDLSIAIYDLHIYEPTALQKSACKRHLYVGFACVLPQKVELLCNVGQGNLPQA